LANRFSDDEAGQIMDKTVDTLRAEIALLRTMVQRLEASIETWKALATAWEFLAESKTNGDA
jgi:prefoldin subunit 5